MSPVRWEEGREGFFPRNRRKRFIRGSGPFTGVLRFSSCLDLTIASSTFAIKIVRVGMEWGSQSSMRTVYPAREYMYTYTGGFRIQCTGIRAAVFPPFSPPLSPSPLSDTIYQRLTVQEFLLTEREAQKFTLRACKRVYLHRRIHDTRTDREHE